MGNSVVMVNFMGWLEKTQIEQYFWVSVRVFLDEISV